MYKFRQLHKCSKKRIATVSTFSQIKEIRDKELNSVILSHLEMSEDLVEGIKSEWEQKKIFKKQIKGDDGTTLIEDSYCTRSYVREIILRYCQNRTFFRTKFNIKFNSFRVNISFILL